MIASILSAVLPDERTAKRREIRQQLAALELDRRACDELRQQIARLDAAKNRAAALHQEATAPLQAELATIDERMSDLLVDRQEIPPALEARRRELLRAVHDANEILETAIAGQDRLAAPLKKDLHQREIRLASWAIVEGKLLVAPLANPDLVTQRFSAGRAVEYARARLDSAREQHRQYQVALADHERFSDEANLVHRARLADWTFELAEAERALQTAKAEADSIHQRILDE